VRVRLVELFTIVGDTDQAVMAARRALANALY
jgi:thioredoxin-like negative regulator of GroEL